MLELRMKIPVNYQILQVFFSSFNYWQEIKQIAHFFATIIEFPSRISRMFCSGNNFRCQGKKFV